MPKRDETIEREVLEFNGQKYYRYPNSKRANHRKYFHGGQQKSCLLHREIWKFHNGSIPPWHDIHHKDENTLNNSIENLDCLPKGRHRTEHNLERYKHGMPQAELDHLERIRPMAAAWHASPEGREWHANNAKTSILKRFKPTKCICIFCDKEFFAKSTSGAKYCSHVCSIKVSYRKTHPLCGPGDVSCAQCGKQFLARFRTRSKYCSISCSNKAFKDRHSKL